jgi:hypothetical protein
MWPLNGRTRARYYRSCGPVCEFRVPSRISGVSQSNMISKEIKLLSSGNMSRRPAVRKNFVLLSLIQLRGVQFPISNLKTAA